MGITDWVLISLSLSISFGTEEDCVRMSLRLCLYLCICIFAPRNCKNMSKYGFHKVTVRWCNQNRHYHFQSNFLKGVATLHISLQTDQKMGERQKEKQKDKMKTQILRNLWCLPQTPQILTNLWCLAQTPQIFVKFHRFWADDLGGEWRYTLNTKH